MSMMLTLPLSKLQRIVLCWISEVQSRCGVTLMRSRELVCGAVLYLLFLGSAATAQPPKESKPKTIGEAWSELIPDFANTTSAEEARAVVLKGIGNDDSEVIRETVYQVGIIALLATMEDYNPKIPDDFRDRPRGSNRCAGKSPPYRHSENAWSNSSGTVQSRPGTRRSPRWSSLPCRRPNGGG